MSFGHRFTSEMEPKSGGKWLNLRTTASSRFPLNQISDTGVPESVRSETLDSCHAAWAFALRATAEKPALRATTAERYGRMENFSEKASLPQRLSEARELAQQRAGSLAGVDNLLYLEFLGRAERRAQLVEPVRRPRRAGPP